MRDYAKEHRQRLYVLDAERRKTNARYVRVIKETNSCADCGEYFRDYPEVLEFDHIGTDKTAAVARMVGQGVSLSKILKEIRKCDIVCANCHRIRTVKRRAG